MIASVTDPRKIKKQLLEHPLQEVEISSSIHLALDFEDPKDCPCEDRGIGVAKVLFKSGRYNMFWEWDFKPQHTHSYAGNCPFGCMYLIQSEQLRINAQA